MMHNFNVALFNVAHFNIVSFTVALIISQSVDSPLLTFTCSKSTIEALEKCVKHIQS